MKKLEMNQMEVVNGGSGPSRDVVLCTLISIGYGLINPVAGIVSSLVCMWA